MSLHSHPLNVDTQALSRSRHPGIELSILVRFRFVWVRHSWAFLFCVVSTLRKFGFVWVRHPRAFWFCAVSTLGRFGFVPFRHSVLRRLSLYVSGYTAFCEFDTRARSIFESGRFSSRGWFIVEHHLNPCRAIPVLVFPCCSESDQFDFNPDLVGSIGANRTCALPFYF